MTVNQESQPCNNINNTLFYLSVKSFATDDTQISECLRTHQHIIHLFLKLLFFLKKSFVWFADNRTRQHRRLWNFGCQSVLECTNRNRLTNFFFVFFIIIIIFFFYQINWMLCTTQLSNLQCLTVLECTITYRTLILWVYDLYLVG